MIFIMFHYLNGVVVFFVYKNELFFNHLTYDILLHQ